MTKTFELPEVLLNRAQAAAAFAARLQREPDGSYCNPDGIEDERFFETLESLRSGRLA